MRPWRLGAAPIVLVASLLGCLEYPPPSSYIEVTEIFTVRQSVVELGPLAPERVGPLIEGYDSPIAEVMPGDRLRLEAIVVDTNGARVEDIETLWVQCASLTCGSTGRPLSDPTYDRRCDELLARTTDDFCVLGTGAGAFEFEVPEIGTYTLLGGPGPRGYLWPQIGLYGVVAWDGRRVEDCWASRRSNRDDLDGCGFIHSHVLLGPIFLVYARAQELGIGLGPFFDVSLGSLPLQVFLQPANRIPKVPELEIRIDGEMVAAGVPPFEPLRVGPGSQIEVSFAFDPLTQLFQRFFLSIDTDDDIDAVELFDEKIFSRTATTGAIVQTGESATVEGDASLTYAVDEFLDPGVSRIWIGYRDERAGSDYLTLEFEYP